MIQENWPSITILVVWVIILAVLFVLSRGPKVAPQGRRVLFCHVHFPWDWKYIPNLHGGRPMIRICKHCERVQTWNYDSARSHGIILWENATKARASEVEALAALRG